MVKTHDYTQENRCWGHDYSLKPIDGGLKAEITGWGRGITAGDYLLLDNNGGSTRYRIRSMVYFGDPSDMWFARAEFAPR